MILRRLFLGDDPNQLKRPESANGANRKPLIASQQIYPTIAAIDDVSYGGAPPCPQKPTTTVGPATSVSPGTSEDPAIRNGRVPARAGHWTAPRWHLGRRLLQPRLNGRRGAMADRRLRYTYRLPPTAVVTFASGQVNGHQTRRPGFHPGGPRARHHAPVTDRAASAPTCPRAASRLGAPTWARVYLVAVRETQDPERDVEARQS